MEQNNIHKIVVECFEPIKKKATIRWNKTEKQNNIIEEYINRICWDKK